MNNKNKISDITDCWVEKGEEPKLIKKGDIVLLHNWGCNNSEQIIGVASLDWDKEYHGWDWSMLSDSSYEIDRYDQWRTSPKVIGHIDDNGNEVITDEDYSQYSENWDILIKEEQAKSELRYKKKQLKDKLKRLKDLKTEKELKVEEANGELKEIEEELRGLK